MERSRRIGFGKSSTILLDVVAITRTSKMDPQLIGWFILSVGGGRIRDTGLAKCCKTEKERQVTEKAFSSEAGWKRCWRKW